jgi:hypothetical protein
MEHIQKLAEDAIQVLSTHRHKTIFFSDCPECKLKKFVQEIHDEATKQPDPDRPV